MPLVYSSVDAQRLLHVYFAASDAADARQDLTPAAEPLQVSIVPLKSGVHGTPHAHNSRGPAPGADCTQEAWIVVRGWIRATLFDLNCARLAQIELGPGSVLVTLRGGHAIESLADDTVIVECKNGPYVGRDYTSFQPMPDSTLSRALDQT